MTSPGDLRRAYGQAQADATASYEAAEIALAACGGNSDLSTAEGRRVLALIDAAAAAAARADRHGKRGAEGFHLAWCCTACRRQLLTRAEMTAVLAVVPLIAPAAAVIEVQGRLAAGSCDLRRTA